MYDLGLRLKETRIQRGLTQKGLAKRISKSVSAISSYESNAQMPPLDVLISIASVLNVSLDFLVGFDNELVFTSKSLSPQQVEVLQLLYSEFITPSNAGNDLSAIHIEIIRRLFFLFFNVSG